METPIIEKRTKYQWNSTIFKSRNKNDKDIYFDCEGLDSEGNTWAWIEKTVYKNGEIVAIENLEFEMVKKNK